MLLFLFFAVVGHHFVVSFSVFGGGRDLLSWVVVIILWLGFRGIGAIIFWLVLAVFFGCFGF